MNGTAYGPDLTLTPHQEDLLRTALSSNNPIESSSQISRNGTLGTTRSNSDPKQLQRTNDHMANGPNMFTSPLQETPGSGQLGSFDESPFLDYELDDGNFDWDNSTDQLFGDLPGTESYVDGEHHDKRKASMDDEDEEEGTSKRREGDDKSAKKPGRKPLTGEPTTKRKAQNRAAQRAFRERKERHLKDLETKVEDLEKASEATNHENGRLRTQVEKMSMELKEYRKRMSLNTTAAGYSPPLSATQSHSYGNGSDFHFNFPKFGDLPGSFMSNGSIAKTTSPTQMGQRSASASSTTPSGNVRKQSSAASKSPPSFNGMFSTPLGQSRPSQVSNNGFINKDYADLNGLFDPSVLENASRNNSADSLSYTTGKASSTPSTAKQDSVGSVNGHAPISTLRNNSSTSITGSPTSSMSHGALDSSCGTTPESSADSPDNRKSSEGGLDTINEEGKAQNKASSNVAKSPAADINGIDWMAQQNGGAFDPVLFGDYRDPQDNILNNNAFGDFFNDAFPLQDFGTPYYTGEVPPKKDLMQEIEIQKNASPSELGPEDDRKQLLACDKLWDRVQSSEKVQKGEADMDDLCSQLKSKAKCSGNGAMIDEKDVDLILGPAREEPSNSLKMFS